MQKKVYLFREIIHKILLEI